MALRPTSVFSRPSAADTWTNPHASGSGRLLCCSARACLVAASLRLRPGLPLCLWSRVPARINI
jgi:hypothetical protein